jgi:cardiolipin synthase A/B
VSFKLFTLFSTIFITMNAVAQITYGSYVEHFETGHQAHLIYSGKELTKTRMSFIMKAKRSIYLSTFIMSAEKTELPLYRALCRRAKEGLDVRVILDFRGSFSEGDNIDKYGKRDDMRSAYAFRQCGIKFEIYNEPRPDNLTQILFAKHDKLLIIDGEEVLLGGSNYASSYTTHGRLEKSWYDLDIAIKGPVACHFQRDFESMWHHLMADQSVFYSKTQQWELYQRFDVLGLKGCHPLKVESGTTQVLGLFNNPKESSFRPLFDTYDVAIQEMVAAKKRDPIYFYAPYFTVDEEFIDLMLYARKHQIPVTIITSSFKSNRGGSSLAVTGMLQTVAPLIAHGVDVRLWSPVEAAPHLWPHKESQIFHRKGGSIGHELFFIGSDNLDTRGQHMSAESVAFIKDEKLNAEFRKDFVNNLVFTIPLTENLRRSMLKDEALYRRIGTRIARPQL